MSRRARNPQPAQKGAPSWALTFGDMMSLLLTFFILLLTFSSIQETKFEQAAGSLKGALGVMRQDTGITSGSSSANIVNVQARQALMMERLTRLVDQSRGQVEIDAQDGELRIRLDDSMLFPTGSARMNPSALPAIAHVAEVVAQEGNEVWVEGHTDDRPISNALYPSNWELSAARALSVVRALEAEGIAPTRMSAAAFGEYRPIAPNTSSETRARNRRVELRIEIDPGLGSGNFFNRIGALNSSRS